MMACRNDSASANQECWLLDSVSKRSENHQLNRHRDIKRFLLRIPAQEWVATAASCHLQQLHNTDQNGDLSVKRKTETRNTATAQPVDVYALMV